MLSPQSVTNEIIKDEGQSLCHTTTAAHRMFKFYTGQVNKTIPSTFVDISAVHENFCMKFYKPINQ